MALTIVSDPFWYPEGQWRDSGRPKCFQKNKIRRFRNNVKVTPGTLRVVAVVQQQPFTGDRGTRTPVQQRCIQKKKGQNHLDNENILTTKTSGQRKHLDKANILTTKTS